MTNGLASRGAFTAGVVVAAALALATAAAARTIVGTSKADILRGTAAADSIYGRAGHDRVFGRGGDDRLRGGHGADRISCGAGRDRVFADARDIVAPDCELVSRAEPQPEPPPPQPPAPEPPGPPPAVPGHYVARSEQGRYVHLDVYPSGRLLTNVRVEYDVDCAPARALRGPFADVPGDILIAPDSSFGLTSSLDGGRLQVTVLGRFDSNGRLMGTFRVVLMIDADGVRYHCDTGVVPFNGGRLQPSAAAPLF